MTLSLAIPPKSSTLSKMFYQFLGALIIANPAVAQQFVQRPSVIPGPVVWSESIVSLDFNDDGKLDLFVTNAQGYAVPGDFGAPSADPLRPTLLLQTGLSGGLPVFQDVTDPLIPAGIVIHGKSTAVCDVDGDGREDLVIAVAFGDQQRLLIKDPVGPGFLDETFRLPALVLNSFSVGWGDLDGDGDVDLVFADAGPNSFSAPGGKARLMINDGLGFFTEVPGKLPAIDKIGSQNAKIQDIDGDLDLDVIIDGKSSVTQVYLNDGSANFTLETNILPLATTVPGAGAYETEWGDLDGDLDLDCIYMNFTAGVGFPSVDAALQNIQTETGITRLRTVGGAFVGNNDQDENDFVLLDVDDDGDLDLLVAALTFGNPVTSEKLFISSGNMGSGFLVETPGAFSGLLDASLDMVAGDFNGDGRTDVVTANGEIPGTDYTNQFYENVGAQDTTDPSIGRVSELPATLPINPLGGAPMVRSWIQDSVVDDGATYVEASLEWSVTDGVSSSNGSLAMAHIGGNIHQAKLELASFVQPGMLGATLDLSVTAEDPELNSSTHNLPSVLVCGAETYGAGTGLLVAAPLPASPGETWELEISGGEANKPSVLLIGNQKANAPLPGGTLLVSPQNSQRMQFTLDGSGSASVTVPVSMATPVGERRFMQSFSRSTVHSSGWLLSNAVETVVCD
ncbi:MAG: hypothetical protein ACI8X5_001319 [Planctomycetota bacterium]